MGLGVLRRKEQRLGVGKCKSQICIDRYLIIWGIKTRSKKGNGNDRQVMC